jgi:hypothetical protein
MYGLFVEDEKIKLKLTCYLFLSFKKSSYEQEKDSLPPTGKS